MIWRITRHLLTILGMGAIPPEEGTYPIVFTDADGTQLDGEHDYVLHFDKQELPPVDAFWSVTMYDQDGFQVANALNRFALGDRDPPGYNEDGSLDLYFGPKAPAGLESNWIETVPGKGFYPMMRFYSPNAGLFDGTWKLPDVELTK